MHQDEIQERSPIDPVWERLRNTATGKEESDTAIAAFRLYRSLPPASRSLYAVALALHQESDPKVERPSRSSVRQVEKWSTHWHWIMRALAWDNEQDRLRREERQERLRNVEASQRKLCKLATQIVLAPMRTLIEMQQNDETLKKVSDQELARAAHRVIRVLPELQARERALLTPTSEGQREIELVYSGSQNWTYLEGGNAREFDLSEQNDTDASRGNPEARSRETQAWSDQPWARQDEPATGKPEPSRAFHAFTVYRDLPPQERTLRRVTELLRGTSATETAGTSGPAKRSRRREHVSETVESWSAKWKWKMRAKAWDDEKDRVRRRAERTEFEQMEKDQSRQQEIARRAAQSILAAMAKRLKGKSLFAGDNTKLVRNASEGVAVLTRSQEAEEALWGDEAAYAERQVLLVEANEFGWGEVNCECGHPHSKHDQTVEDQHLMPCTVTGCACEKFVEPDPEVEANRIAPYRGGLPANLEVSDPI